MKREYDLSKGMRGRYYRKSAELRLPIYLDPKIQRRLEHIARRKGKAVGHVVNQLLRKEFELLESLA